MTRILTGHAADALALQRKGQASLDEAAIQAGDRILIHINAEASFPGISLTKLNVYRRCVVAAKESQSERTEKFPLFNLAPAEVAAMGQKRMENFVNAQTELLDKLRETNQQWVERMQSEASEASEFASKLTTAHSLPEAMTAWQEWISRSFAMMAEDGKHVFADTQKFMEMGARLLSNGWSSKKPTGPGT